MFGKKHYSKMILTNDFIKMVMNKDKTGDSLDFL